MTPPDKKLFRVCMNVSKIFWCLALACVCFLGLAPASLFSQSPDFAASNPLAVAAQDGDDQPAPLWQRIDQIVNAIHLGPEIPLASDYEFQRRVYLDLIGRGPTIEEIQSYQAHVASSPDGSLGARRALIDDLLARPEFSRYYAKVLEIVFSERREGWMMEFRNVIRQWLEDHRPLNELCTEILGSDGTHDELRSAASFVLDRNADPHQLTRDIGRIFFGRDVQCAQCHDHPLVADYEQSEYFGILSFVNRTYLFTDERRGNAILLGEKGEGALEFASVFLPENGKSSAQPILPMSMAMDIEPDFVDGSDAYMVAPDKDKRGIPRYSRRQQLAVLATHPENDSFNRNLANRLWANMMGMGVVHPVDMHHSDNPPISAALLRLLADALVACDYDLREFLRQIARSATYQRSVQPPDLHLWDGPSGGDSAFEAELAGIQQSLDQLKPQRKRLDAEMSEADAGLKKSQADVAKLHQQGDEARKQLLMLVEQRDKNTADLAELQTQKTRQQELNNALRAAMSAADKILQLAPEDQQLAASRALLDARLKAANEANPVLDEQMSQQHEVVERANYRVDDQRNRILALANRRLALGEFVVEARGVQRRLRKQMQALIDQQSDLRQREQRIASLQKWLSIRNEVRESLAGVANAGKDVGAEEVVGAQKELEMRQAELIESWRRDFAVRRVRGLSPEQLAATIYVALDMGRAVREKALADWNASQGDSVDCHDKRKRQMFVEDATAGHMWGALEKTIMRRFSAPAGAPQDGFIATVDHALMIQNDPLVQAWLQPADGSFMQRLIAMEDGKELANNIYLSLLGRFPDAEEVEMVTHLLAEHASERSSIVQELVWGLLASAEFRFIL